MKKKVKVRDLPHTTMMLEEQRGKLMGLMLDSGTVDEAATAILAAGYRLPEPLSEEERKAVKEARDTQRLSALDAAGSGPQCLSF